MRIPAIIDHTEINPTGNCIGDVVQEAENVPSWECTSCGAKYNAVQLRYLSGDYIRAYSEDYLSDLRQDDMRDYCL